jgi:hypothetical protein
MACAWDIDRGLSWFSEASTMVLGYAMSHGKKLVNYPSFVVALQCLTFRSFQTQRENQWQGSDGSCGLRSFIFTHADGSDSEDLY